VCCRVTIHARVCLVVEKSTSAHAVVRCSVLQCCSVLHFASVYFSVTLKVQVCSGIEYGVATISRLLKIIGLFYRISSLL